MVEAEHRVVTAHVLREMLLGSRSGRCTGQTVEVDGEVIQSEGDREWEAANGSKSNPGAAVNFKPGPRQNWNSKATGSRSSTHNALVTRCLREF
jgi:hypothetical protein